jgi:hypothetical protein
MQTPTLVQPGGLSRQYAAVLLVDGVPSVTQKLLINR